MLIIAKIGFHFYLELKQEMFFPPLEQVLCFLDYRTEIELFLAFWS